MTKLRKTISRDAWRPVRPPGRWCQYGRIVEVADPKGERPEARGSGGHIRPPDAAFFARAERWGVRLRALLNAGRVTTAELAGFLGCDVGEVDGRLPVAYFCPDITGDLASCLGVDPVAVWEYMLSDDPDLVL